MSNAEFILVVIALAILGLALLVSTITATFVIVQDRLDRRRRHRTLTDEDVADALAPFGADISVWPVPRAAQRLHRGHGGVTAAGQRLPEAEARAAVTATQMRPATFERCEGVATPSQPRDTSACGARA